MDRDDYILALLSGGPKSFTELANEMVDKVCARGTLDKHLKNLANEKKIRRELFPNRTTRYYLMPESLDRARLSRDVINLESLMVRLEYKTRKELTLEEIKPEKEDWIEIEYRKLEPTKNRPRMNFGLHLDETTTEVVNLIQSTSKLASEFQDVIRSKLKEIKQKMPGTIQDEKAFIQSPKDWFEIKDFSRKMALKHGLRFLVYSYYDGEEYKKRITSAIRTMEGLEKDHEEDIYFLNELNKRCYYSSLEYYYDIFVVLEDMLFNKDFLKISDPYQLLEEALLMYHTDGELMWLEVALVSESAETKLPKKTLKDRLRRGALEEIHSPYRILAFKDYLRMKLPLLSANSRKYFVRNLLEGFSGFLRADGEQYSRDYFLHSDDYHLTINLLLEKLSVEENEESGDIKSPVMNFRFHDQHREIDFSDQPFVRNFQKLARDARKKKWLKECLSLGLPIFQYIPFGKLGHEVSNVL